MNTPKTYTRENAHELRIGAKVVVGEGGRNGAEARYIGINGISYPFAVVYLSDGFADYVSSLTRPVPTTLDDIEAGDYVVDAAGSARKILARNNDCVLTSACADGNWEARTGAWLHIEELKYYGYTLPAEESAEEPAKKEIKEVTLDEVMELAAKKFGVEPSQIRVKKDD